MSKQDLFTDKPYLSLFAEASKSGENWYVAFAPVSNKGTPSIMQTCKSKDESLLFLKNLLGDKTRKVLKTCNCVKDKECKLSNCKSKISLVSDLDERAHIYIVNMSPEEYLDIGILKCDPCPGYFVITPHKGTRGDLFELLNLHAF